MPGAVPASQSDMSIEEVGPAMSNTGAEPAAADNAYLLHKQRGRTTHVHRVGQCLHNAKQITGVGTSRMAYDELLCRSAS